MTRDRARPLAAYLVAFGLSLAVPLITYAAVITVQFAASERARVEAHAREVNGEILGAIEREITGQIAMLQALATASSLRDGDFQRFSRHAAEFFRLHRTHVVLRDRTGQQLVNTRVPWGSALPVGAAVDTHRKVFAEKAPSVSDLFIGAVSGRPAVAVAVPVLVGGEAAYSLNASIPVERLHGMFQLDGVAPPYNASIVDRNGVILARSGANGEFVGKPLPGHAEGSGAEGVWTDLNLQGVPAKAVYRRSPLTGWTVVVDVPQAAMEAPLRRSLWHLAGLGLLLFLGAGALACMVTGAMTRSVRALTGMAQDLGAGRDVSLPPLPIREARRIGAALAEAALGLRERDAALAQANRELERRVGERTRALAESEARYRLLAEHATDMVVQSDLDTTRRYVSPAAREPLGYEPEELIGTRPLDFAHPDDVEGYTRVLADLTEGRISQAATQQRYRRKDGAYVWVEVKFRLITNKAGQPTGYVAAIRDVSARMQAEEAIREREARFRLLAENASDIIMLKRPGGERTYV